MKSNREMRLSWPPRLELTRYPKRTAPDGTKVFGPWWRPRYWSPFFKAFGVQWYLQEVITFWHVDPEADGTDDSCSWFHPKLTDREREVAWDLIDNELDNIRGWITGNEYDQKRKLEQIFRVYKRNFKWRLHPRWHVWHWKIQVHPAQVFKRWVFSRCAGCGRRFTWGYSPVTYQWKGTGPRWFRGERGVYHSECSTKVVAG